MKRIAVMIFFLTAALSFAQEEQFVYDGHGRRDPFWRLVGPSGAIVNYETDLLISDMTLEGIIYDPSGKSFAIINGTVAKLNDRIGLYVVSRIDKNQVILKKGQENFMLELKKEE